MLRFRRDRVANTPSATTGTGHRRCEPARPPRNALRRFTFVRHHDAPMASFRPALAEASRIAGRVRPSSDRPVNSGPRPCLFGVGFPLSGLQVRTYTSDLNIRARHTRSRTFQVRHARCVLDSHPPVTTLGVAVLMGNALERQRGPRENACDLQSSARTSPSPRMCDRPRGGIASADFTHHVCPSRARRRGEPLSAQYGSTSAPDRRRRRDLVVRL
jgi:hypothetical protein